MTEKFPKRPDSSSRHRRSSPVGRSLIHDNGLYNHRLCILLEVVLGIRNGGAKDSFKETRTLLGRIPEKFRCIGHGHPADHLGHNIGLLRSEPSGCVVSVHDYLAGAGAGLGAEATAVSALLIFPPWILNFVVQLNSPSL